MFNIKCEGLFGNREVMSWVEWERKYRHNEVILRRQLSAKTSTFLERKGLLVRKRFQGESGMKASSRERI